VSYNVTLAIPKGKIFYGEVDVFFVLHKLNHYNPLFLDFYGVDIGDLFVNGKLILTKNSDKESKKKILN